MSKMKNGVTSHSALSSARKFGRSGAPCPPRFMQPTSATREQYELGRKEFLANEKAMDAAQDHALLHGDGAPLPKGLKKRLCVGCLASYIGTGSWASGTRLEKNGVCEHCGGHDATKLFTYEGGPIKTEAEILEEERNRTKLDMELAASLLASHHRGQAVLKQLGKFFEGDYARLDAQNRDAVQQLVIGSNGGWAGTAIDLCKRGAAPKAAPKPAAVLKRRDTGAPVTVLSIESYQAHTETDGEHEGQCEGCSIITDEHGSLDVFRSGLCQDEDGVEKFYLSPKDAQHLIRLARDEA